MSVPGESPPISSENRRIIQFRALYSDLQESNFLLTARKIFPLQRQ
jgi:hypothetical protein